VQAAAAAAAQWEVEAIGRMRRRSGTLIIRAGQTAGSSPHKTGRRPTLMKICLLFLSFCISFTGGARMRKVKKI
jgi:hypothetical protein